MEINVSFEYIDNLNKYKKHFLFIKDENLICYINDFEYFTKNKIIKHWFRPNEIVQQFFITKLDIVTYHENDNELAFFSDNYIEIFFIDYNIEQLRINWIDLKKQFNAFGIIISKMKKDNLK